MGIVFLSAWIYRRGVQLFTSAWHQPGRYYLWFRAGTYHGSVRGIFSGTAGGKSFEVVLTREESNDAIIFPMLDEFTLRVKRAYSVVTYSKCRLKSVEIERRAGEPLLEKITLTAEGRKEV